MPFGVSATVLPSMFWLLLDFWEGDVSAESDCLEFQDNREIGMLQIQRLITLSRESSTHLE